MTAALDTFVARSLNRPTPAFVAEVAGKLAGSGALTVLFYGSNLRTGARDGVLDFYVLTDDAPERGIWPRVGYIEFPHGGGTLRAKIATVTLATFARAAAGRSLDTTIWARFVQPAAIVWTADEGAAGRTREAVAAAAVTAARFAAALGPGRGSALDHWRALFRHTYAAEFRVEAQGREDGIVDHEPERYAALLPLAWEAGGVAFSAEGDALAPRVDPAERARLLRRWRWRRRWGKPLNLARIVRAAWTFEGAGAYGLWKVERHTGVRVPLTPWRARHPVLAAPGVLWRVWRARRT